MSLVPSIIRTKATPACFVCGGDGQVLYSNLADNLFAAPGLWTIKCCLTKNCGMLWLDPMPLAQDLSHAYTEYYTHGKAGRSSAAFNVAKRAYRILVDCLLFGAGIPAERKRASLMFIGDHAPGSILDVGCGHGTFLALMANRGWAAAGVDFDAEAVEAARRLHGLDVKIGTAETVVAEGKTFDVVTASHVIEHVPDPIAFLAACRRLLKPGGRLIVRTPNVESFGHKRYLQNWRGLEPPRHLHLFTVPALVRCGRAAGFAHESCFTTSIGAEGILLASYFQEKTGEFRPANLSKMNALGSKLLGPLFALQGKREWWRDTNSGEEICIVLSNDAITTK